MTMKQIPIVASKRYDIPAKILGGGIARTLCASIVKQTANQPYTFVMVVYETDTDKSREEQ